MSRIFKGCKSSWKGHNFRYLWTNKKRVIIFNWEKFVEKIGENIGCFVDWCNISCSRHRKTKFTNSESPIFTTIFLITLDLCIHFVFLSPLSNSKCIKKSSNFHLKNKKYWGFGIRKFGFSMTWARYMYLSVLNL